MNRIFLDSPVSADQFSVATGLQIDLNPDLSHHLRDVLRLSEGKQLVVVCKDSAAEFLAIVSVCKQKLPVSIKILTEINKRKVKQIVGSLICALPKGSHADQICEQVAQFGVGRIIFWQSSRSIAKLQNEANRLDRWKKIVEASARQSQGSIVPEVSYFSGFEDLIACMQKFDLQQDLLAVCSLSENAKMLSELTAPSGQIHLIIGPEGDFSPEEESMFYQLGAKSVSLGQHVLRVETAALAAVAAASILRAV